MIIFGTSESDVFILDTKPSDDVYLLGKGNDVLTESTALQSISNDLYIGGAGDDVVTTYWGNDTILLGAGDDVVYLYGPDIADARGGKGYDIAYIGIDTSSHPMREKDDGYVDHHLRGFEEVVFL